MLETRILQTYLLNGGDDVALEKLLREATRRGEPILEQHEALKKFFDDHLKGHKVEDMRWYVPLVRYAASVQDAPLSERLFRLLPHDLTSFKCGSRAVEGMFWPFNYPRERGITLTRPLRMVHPVSMDLIWTPRRVREFVDRYLEKMTEWFLFLCPGTELLTDCYLQLLEASTSDKPEKYLVKADKLAQRASDVVKNRTKKRTSAYINGSAVEVSTPPHLIALSKYITHAFSYACKEDIAMYCGDIMEAYQRVSLYFGIYIERRRLGRLFIAHLMGFDHRVLDPSLKVVEAASAED